MGSKGTTPARHNANAIKLPQRDTDWLRFADPDNECLFKRIYFWGLYRIVTIGIGEDTVVVSILWLYLHRFNEWIIKAY